MIIFLFFLSLGAWSVELSEKEKEDLILNAIYVQLYEKTKDIKVDVPNKKSVNSGGRGREILERIKRENREKLALKNGVDPRLAKSGSDIVSAAKEDNKKFLIHANEVRSQLEAVKSKALSKKQWSKELEALKADWEKEKREYLKNIKTYKANLFDIPLVLPVDESKVNEPVSIEIDREFHFVNKSLAIGVKDQKARATCSAFTGVRSIEVALAQAGKTIDLSEQYFYWSSKPDCRNRKCSKKGSWVGFGFDYSKKQSSLNIPLEKDCPYQSYTSDDNETSLPLSDGCSKAVVKVESFKHLDTLDDAVRAIQNNKVVIMSTKLSPNFYQNEGLILMQDKNKGGQLDDHALGHSIILNGLVKLPSVLNEGRFCFIATNSWGTGWGMGGYSCLSENWILSHRQKNPFVVVNKVKF